VVTEDTEREVRFEIPKLLIEHNVRSTVNVVIRGEDGPFGVLEVDARQLRKFEQDDIDFLQNYANLLASAIDRVRIQRELAERALKQEMLGHELQHRINNMLATIQAIARRTRAKSQTLDEFAKSFEDRLAAIARTHALLSRTRTSTIDIRKLLSQELAVHGAVEGENLRQRGPEISIPAKQAEVLSMAIHELATNAVKHGALSMENGHIDIRGTLMIVAMKMNSNSAGGSGPGRLRTSRPGGASVRSFSRNRYHICCTGDSSERSVPMG
jgi:two-component sensor histidine kinase